jgi:hypothetical protein
MSVKSFVQHIEDNIYKKELIYRSILVTKNYKECNVLKRMLEIKDYTPIIIEYIDKNTNYNHIDNRIIIICYDMFENFIKYLDSQEGGILDSSFNFIAFSYSLDTQIVDNLVSFYVEKTHNNANNTIILEKNYTDFLYIQKYTTESVKCSKNTECTECTECTEFNSY